MVSFCKDSLPQRGSSLLKVQAAVVSLHSQGERSNSQIFTKNCLSDNQQAFTENCSLHSGLHAVGKREGGKSTSLFLQKVRGHEQMVSWGEEGGGPGRGCSVHKPARGEACPS